MKKLTIIIAVVVVGALAATPLYAAVFRAGESVAINASDVQGSNDVYSAGGSVSILSAISGDAVLAGGTIIVSGNVANDLVTVGGSVVVSGNVGGDARIAGGSLVVEGDIAEDMLIGGGDINISNAVAVGGDLYVAGGAVNVRGTVTGETKIRAGQVTLGGNFTGPVDIVSDEAVVIERETIVQGSIKIRSPKEPIVNDGASLASNISYEKIERVEKRFNPFPFLGALVFLKVVAMIIVSLLLLWIFPRATRKVVRVGLGDFWRSALIGLIVGVVTPIALVLLAVSVVGIWAGIILGLLFVVLVMLSAALSGIFFGTWLDTLHKKTKDIVPSWIHVVLGSILLAIVSFVPFVGGIIVFIIFLGIFGAVVKTAYFTARGN